MVALQGIRGGTGASALVAALAEALAQADESVLCIDMDPRNLLRLHFNHSWADTQGWASTWHARRPWHETAFAIDERVHFVPHGQLPTEAVEALERHHHDEPEAWHQRLAELDASAYRWVLLDVPAHSRDAQRQARRAADLWLQVAHADPACHALLAAHTITVGEYLLINRFTARSTLQGDLHRLWQTQYADWLLPFVIHRDEAMFEALAHKRSVVGYRPDSLAAQDVQRLAAWLLAQRGGGE